jgi:pimeloyl-ACP methyl ester carboxylesterase
MDFDKEKPSILLMHGSGLTHIVWSLHEQFYASQGFNILSVDLPGHGNSEGPSLKSIEEISDWVKSLMNVLDIKKIIIIGHSQGCLVGIDFASRYPNLINSLVLVAGCYKMPVNQDLINYAEAGDEKAILLMMKWGYEGSKAFIGGNPVKKIINSSREIREVLAVDLNACNNYKGGKESLEKINCQTLCIFGDLDKMVPLEVGNKMISMIKNSEKKIINNCGHMIIFEKAFEMRKIVKEFLTK